MKQTIVAAFQDQNRAEEALNALMDAGFPRADAHLTSLSETTSTDSSRSDNSNEDESLGQKIGKLFGMGSDDEENSSQAGGEDNNVLRVDVDSEAKAEHAQGIIERFEPTGIDMRSSDDLVGSGSLSSEQHDGEVVVPIVEEELKVGKRETTEGGVNVTSHNYDESVEEDVHLHEEHTDVSSRPVDRKATKEELAFGEVELEARDTKEEVVVDKEARVVEEVVVSTEGSDRKETVKEDLRRTDVDVEQVGKDGASRSPSERNVGKKGAKRNN
ncbi:DUF2382 domain-containing protein [Pistricoccus aurantiacus]|uniref:DUF2382 domain-containing protein n=1 Tax=Pistricoccus aurantiacus TaxID=1883414 RepID=UPI0036451799